MNVWRFGDSVTDLREALDRGGILAIPTESSYGLAADPWSERGVRAIYQVKGAQADARIFRLLRSMFTIVWTS